jgi:hypothetical protein
VRFCDVEIAAVRAPEGNVSGEEADCRSDAKPHLAEFVENPDRAETGMRYDEGAPLVEGEPVRTRQPARELNELRRPAARPTAQRDAETASMVWRRKRSRSFWVVSQFEV